MDLKILQDTPPWDWPRSTGKTLLGILRNPQADIAERLLAAEFSSQIVVINDALAEALLAIVGSAAEPEDLRAQAAISLGPVLEMADTYEFDEDGERQISEKTFRRIKQALRKVYVDSGAPKLLRRRILEAAVRAPEEWHSSAIRSAWAGTDQEWKLTAVFGMRHVRGFDKQILEALANADPDIHCEAVRAAAEWEIDNAWPHVVALLGSPDTGKDLLLAAIEAAACIRPREAGVLLVDLVDSEDEEIAEGAEEAMSMASGYCGDEFDEEDDDEYDDDDEDEDDSTGGRRETVH